MAAKGKYSRGECQKCGDVVPYLTLRRDGQTGLKVCGPCYDIKHPAEKLRSFKDHQSLRDPSPITGKAESNTPSGPPLRTIIPPTFGGGT